MEEALIIGAPDAENGKYTIKFIQDWREELAKLLEGPDLLVTSEWRPGMDTLDHENYEYSFQMTTATWKKQCPVCLQRPGCMVGEHVNCNHLPWFAYPWNACW